MNKFCLLMLFAFVLSCKKDPLKYTGNMSGSHVWLGTRYYQGGLHNDSIVAPIVVIDDKTVVFRTAFSPWNDTLHYISSSKSAKTLTYTSLLDDGIDIEDYDTIIYNYSNNSILFNEYSSYKGYSEITHFHTP